MRLVELLVGLVLVTIWVYVVGLIFDNKFKNKKR